MGLFRVVYHSRSRLDLATKSLADHVADIVAVAVANNCNAGVTGALVCDPAWFIQVLEGKRDAVMRTLERVSRDPRHSEIAVADASAAEARRFSHWWMAGAVWRDGEAGLFLPVVSAAGFAPRDLPADALVDLVEAVVHHQGQNRGRLPWTTKSATSAA
jgi:hypothetical protein